MRSIRPLAVIGEIVNVARWLRCLRPYGDDARTRPSAKTCADNGPRRFKACNPPGYPRVAIDSIAAGRDRQQKTNSRQ